jgi:hypothetical protein
MDLSSRLLRTYEAKRTEEHLYFLFLFYFLLIFSLFSSSSFFPYFSFLLIIFSFSSFSPHNFCIIILTQHLLEMM